MSNIELFKKDMIIEVLRQRRIVQENKDRAKCERTLKALNKEINRYNSVLKRLGYDKI